MYKKMFYNLKIFSAFIIIFLLMVSCIMMSEQIKISVENSVTACLSIIIPSLYGFMIISDFTVISGLSDIIGLPFRFISERVFKIPSNMFGVFLLSLVGGYPVGIKCIYTLVDNGELEEKEAESLSCICFASGPAFIIGTVALQLYNSMAVGMTIFISITLANILLAFIMGIGKPIPQRKLQKNKINISADAFIKAVQNSAKALLQVCAMIIAFSVLLEILLQSGIISNISEFISKHFSVPANDIDNFLLTFLEISHITDFGHNNYTLLPIITILLSFGGTCVLLQIIALSKGRLNLIKFLSTRLFAAVCSAFFSQLIIKIFPQLFIISAVKFRVTTPSNTSIIPSICLIIMTLLLLSSRKARQ